jgi:predicted nuclease with TOPRIM domain
MNYRDFLHNKLAAARGRVAQARAQVEEQRERVETLERERQNTAQAEENLAGCEQSLKLYKDECDRLGNEVESAERGAITAARILSAALRSSHE